MSYNSRQYLAYEEALQINAGATIKGTQRRYKEIAPVVSVIEDAAETRRINAMRFDTAYQDADAAKQDEYLKKFKI